MIISYRKLFCVDMFFCKHMPNIAKLHLQTTTSLAVKDALERSQMKDRMGNLVGSVTSRVSYVGFTGIFG